ncbi:hypothetical protein G3W41_29300, partial [Klebsiella pneumoniae]|nr:hypothetical protein [Klebsiella pneumoniae]
VSPPAALSTPAFLAGPLAAWINRQAAVNIDLAGSTRADIVSNMLAGRAKAVVVYKAGEPGPLGEDRGAADWLALIVTA